MYRTFILPIVVLGGIALSAAPASATDYTITFTGILTSGTDGIGAFGAAGADLSATAFTASFEYDTSLGTQAGSTAVFNQLCGGAGATPFGCAADSLPTPVNGAMTINGITHEFPGSDLGFVQTGYPGDIPGGVLSASAIDLSADSYLEASVTEVSDLPTSLETVLAKTSDVNMFTFQFAGTAGALTLGSATGNPGTVEIALTPTVPEPATWAMMLAGMAAVGSAMRRRRTVSVAYA